MLVLAVPELVVLVAVVPVAVVPGLVVPGLVVPGLVVPDVVVPVAVVLVAAVPGLVVPEVVVPEVVVLVALVPATVAVTAGATTLVAVGITVAVATPTVGALATGGPEAGPLEKSPSAAATTTITGMTPISGNSQRSRHVLRPGPARGDRTTWVRRGCGGVYAPGTRGLSASQKMCRTQRTLLSGHSGSHDRRLDRPPAGPLPAP